ncbi:hypothetical protein BKA66DRAFT_447707 [Pyrenochaeta sp. MPI-SDFR-AT-0127]|nr:hypothetical protein BKA66DRAFT_447707 [Pyrenochaeta sp. MPI-SDFR-AT-0127]
MVVKGISYQSRCCNILRDRQAHVGNLTGMTIRCIPALSSADFSDHQRFPASQSSTQTLETIALLESVYASFISVLYSFQVFVTTTPEFAAGIHAKKEFKIGDRLLLKKNSLRSPKKLVTGRNVLVLVIYMLCKKEWFYNSPKVDPLVFNSVQIMNLGVCSSFFISMMNDQLLVGFNLLAPAWI